MIKWDNSIEAIPRHIKFSMLAITIFWFRVERLLQVGGIREDIESDT